MPSMTIPATLSAWVEVTEAPEICQSPAATISRPAAAVNLAPISRTRSGEAGATTATAAAAGSTCAVIG